MRLLQLAGMLSLLFVAQQSSRKRAAARMVPALRIAVYDLELQNVTQAVGVVVTDSLLTEVRKLQGVSAIGMNEIRGHALVRSDQADGRLQ